MRCPLVTIPCLVAAVFGLAACDGERGAPVASLRNIELVDQAGFAQPMPAFALQAPEGWTSEGGVQWDRRTACANNQVRVNWRAISPDGRQAVELMHGFNWQVQGRAVQLNPCPVVPFASTQAFLEAVARQRRPGAAVVGYRERPDLAEASRASTPAPQNGARHHHDAGELVLALEQDGQRFEERLVTAVVFSEFQGSVMGGTSMVFAQRAPEGRFDAAVGEAVRRSVKPRPEWLAATVRVLTAFEQRRASGQRQAIDQWHAAEMARIDAQGAADRAAIRAQTQRDLARIQSQTHANTQATNDRMHRRTMEAVGEYDTWRDSGGNTVRSSIHGGDRVLRHPDGSYSSTRDPYYLPPGGEELKKVR